MDTVVRTCSSCRYPVKDESLERCPFCCSWLPRPAEVYADHSTDDQDTLWPVVSHEASSGQGLAILDKGGTG